MMKLKTYQAPTMAEALSFVRRDLGKEAVILNTRSIRKGGFLGFRTRNLVEITATSGVNVLHPDQKKRVLKSTNDPRSAAPETAPESVSAVADPPVNEALRHELNLVKQMVQELLSENKRHRHPAVPQELFNTYLGLINQQVAQDLADEMIEQIRETLTADEIKDPEQVRQAIRRSIEKMVPPAQPIVLDTAGKTKVIALVGPTGVGKTTTIAKLAANFKLRENRSVGLITIDTYRIAAVDQLRTYADIINVPLRVVLTPEELREAVRSFKGVDLVLIDTAGRSQNDDLKLRELRSFLQAAKPDEVHLVLSTTASQANLTAALERFACLNVDRVIFTKLDEAVGLGMLLNVVKTLQRAVSYITTGQNVPEDIEPAAGDRLASLLLNPANWTGGEAGFTAPINLGGNRS